jgi:hypothetical protein
VDGVGIVRDANTVASQLFAESYRPRTGHHGGLLQLGHPLRQILRPEDGGFPEALAVWAVERDEDLPPPAVEDGEGQAPAPFLDPSAERVEGADAPRRQPEADRETAGGRDPDPDPGEGAGAEPDREQVDAVPAAGRGRRLLDLLQQPGRVQGPSLGGQPQLRLVQDLAVAPGAGDGVDRRGVEADDDQGSAIP